MSFAKGGLRRRIELAAASHERNLERNRSIIYRNPQLIYGNQSIATVPLCAGLNRLLELLELDL